MNATFKPHRPVLPVSQQRLWPDLKPAADLGFVLYGGTAVALRLGHRASVDFDFFSDRPLDRAALEAAFPFLARSTILQDERESLGLLVPCTGEEGEHVKVSFFGAIRFGRVGQPDATEDGVLQVASLDDLMATKLKVVLRRAEAKDYRDIAAMLRAGVKLSVGLAAARALFGPHFQPSESLKALVYFGDGGSSALSDEDRNVLVEAASAVRELSEVRLLSDKLTLDRNGRPPQRPIPVPRNGYPAG